MNRETMKVQIIVRAGLCFLVLLAFNASLAVAAPPAHDTFPAGGKYLGAGSCAASACHGSEKPRKTNNILQNEYVTWARHGQHSGAWDVLLEADAKRIGMHLGITAPETDPTCLKCHATYVSKETLQGERYQLEDGVSCESCHGPAENWIKSHTATGNTHEDNVRNGMRDLFPLEQRARLCMECHYGTDEKYVNHTLIGAGHPRLSFELDTFSMLQPRHWKVDSDYEKRKGSYSSSRSWLVGQVTLALATLEALESPERSRNGIFPELTLFNCFACHHNLGREEWKKRNYGGNPGQLVLNTASLQMVALASDALSLPARAELHEGLKALQQNYRKGTAAPVIKNLTSLLKSRLIPAIKNLELNINERQSVAKGLLTVATRPQHLHYEEAEQLTMAIASIMADGDFTESHKKHLNQMFDQLEVADEFESAEFKNAAGTFLKSM